MIRILRNMLLGCGGSHLNEFAVYHRSQEKANQSLPLHSDGWRGGRWRDGGEKWRCDRRESSSVCRRCLPQQPSAKGFPKGTLVLIKTGPILNSNPLACLASAGDALSNHWNRWMFLHYRGWTASINRARSSLMPGVTSDFTAHLSREPRSCLLWKPLPIYC